MRLLADECVAGSIVAELRNAGLDVLWMSETAPGCSDDAVLDRAFTESRVLVTEDKDFGELTLRLGRPAFGVILLALWSLPADRRTRRAVSAIQGAAGRIEGHFVVIEPSRLRRRRLSAGVDRAIR